jgi:hypothetical protein
MMNALLDHPQSVALSPHSEGQLNAGCALGGVLGWVRRPRHQAWDQGLLECHCPQGGNSQNLETILEH